MRNELLGTASVNLSNVLKNNGGKSTYDDGVADMIHLWGVGEEFRRLGFLSHTTDRPGDAVSSRTRGCGDSVPHRRCPWSFRKARALLCLHCGIQPILSSGSSAGMQ